MAAPKKNFRFAKKKSRGQNLKTTFPKDFFIKICLKEEYEYINIFEIKFEKKNILFKNGGQNKFCDILQ